MATYISPAQATKTYEKVCAHFNVKRPTFSHYIRYRCINFPSFTAMLKMETEHAQKWSREFIAESEVEWKMIREKRYKGA